MKYAIQVNGAPGPSSSGRNAYDFIRAALAEGHQIVRVFFYRDGVYNGFEGTLDRGLNPPDWSGLARSHGLDLILCVSAAERRGLKGMDSSEGFRIGGLGQWMDACLKADRVLTFGS